MHVCMYVYLNGCMSVCLYVFVSKHIIVLVMHAPVCMYVCMYECYMNRFFVVSSSIHVRTYSML